jgi:hypothetical protein
MDAGFDLGRRELIGAFATTLVTADSLETRLFRRNSPTRGRASTAAMPEAPSYFSNLPMSTRALTPEALVLRSVPTTCPPILEMTQDVLRLDGIRLIKPEALKELTPDNNAFWSNLETGVGKVRETLAASPPLLRLFVPEELTRQTNQAVNELEAAIDALQLVANERNATLLEAGVVNVALKLEALGRYTVGRFPYSVPRGGRFETLPRLLGRGEPASQPSTHPPAHQPISPPIHQPISSSAHSPIRQSHPSAPCRSAGPVPGALSGGRGHTHAAA